MVFCYNDCDELQIYISVGTQIYHIKIYNPQVFFFQGKGKNKVWEHTVHIVQYTDYWLSHTT